MRSWFASKWIALDNRAGSRLRPRPVGGLRRPLVALVALAAVGVLAAGCGSDTSGSGGSGSGGYGSGGSTPSTGPSGVAMVTPAGGADTGV